jgi:hypothetical protein
MKETFYFSHDYNARGDEKIVKLISKESWGGYGIFWAITEKLFEADGYLELDYDCLAFDLRTESERITRIINDYNLFVVENNKFYSKSVLERLNKRKEKSGKARESANTRWSNANAKPTQSDSYAIKKRKGKESKVNIISEPSSQREFSFKEELEKMKTNIINPLIPIIALYWEYKKLTPPTTKEQFNIALKRELRASSNLKVYPIERIREVMFALNGTTIDWVLETVVKYIDRDLTKLNFK